MAQQTSASKVIYFWGVNSKAFYYIVTIKFISRLP